MRALTLSLLLLILPGVSGAADDATTIARGRELTELYHANPAASWARMSPNMQRFLRSEDAFARFNAAVRQQLGREVELLEEKTRRDGTLDVYVRRARWSIARKPVVIEWAFTADALVEGFLVQEEEPPPQAAATAKLDYVTRTALRLPFDEEWTVFQGGRSVEQNRHALDVQQRFAYDLVVARGGRTHRSDGTKLEHYYCWDQPIRAPAAGTVVAAIDGVRDQQPGVMDKANLAGNHVMLDLGNGEYALLAHLRNGSVRVKPGDRVRLGTTLGRCGNSGNTTEPHLHFHLQDSPRLGEGSGLPAFFVDYFADGEPVARGEPVKGQRIRN